MALSDLKKTEEKRKKTQYLTGKEVREIAKANQAEMRRLEKAKKVTEEAKTAAEEAKAAYDDLKSTIEDF
jgi:hypothetical protein